jgi:Bacterial Ig domain
MAKPTKSKNGIGDDVFIDASNDTFVFHHAAVPTAGPEASPSNAAPIATLSDEFCPRQISFTIPGKAGVLVTATENDGKIDFVVDVLGDPKASDLRGLFMHFNESKLAGLQITGGDGWIAETQINSNKVIDLGQGANMHGKAAPFDVGIEFGTPGKGKDFLDEPIHFTFSNAANNLTLDDFAHLQFGARLTSMGDKIVTLAPAAPDAVDDLFNNIFEDGASGLDSPSKTPTAVVLDVLGNDTDADGDQLSITAFHDGPSHGTVEISADGKSILYTPFLDYSGPDSFEYCVSDGNGGQDHAKVDLVVTAVADKPTIDVEVLAGADVYHVILNVTASQNDVDNSEFIDRFEASVAGVLPPGVTIAPLGGINPADEPTQISRQFEVTLPAGQDIKFDLDLTAFSQETSNGDQEVANKAVTIELDFNHNVLDRTFVADDRSIWENDQALGFKDSDFFGIDHTFDPEPEITVPVPIPPTPLFVNATADVDGHFKFGIEYDIEINGGKIDAQAPVEVTLDTTYNRTTDMLQIDADSFTLAGLAFQTEGPGGHFFLDAVADINLQFDLDISLPVGPGFDVLPDSIDSLSGSKTLEIVHISDTDSISIPLPAGFSVTAAFPADVDATGITAAPTNAVTGSDDSNNFLQIDWNVGVGLSQFVPIVSPLFAPLPVVVPPLVGTITPVVATIGIGADFVQTFTLTMQGLEFDVVLEDGTHYDLDPVNGVQIANASSHDIDNDGLEFTLAMTPSAQLNNDTNLGVNFSWNLDLITADLTVPLPVNDLVDFLEDVIEFIFGEDVDLPNSIDIDGALVDLGDTDVPVAEIDVLNNTFALQFNSQNATFVV